MAAHAAFETQAHDHGQHRYNREIGAIEPMRLVLCEKARTKPVDCMQYRVPREDVAHPVGHHPRHIEDPRTEIQYTGQLSPDFVPRFEECVEDGINETEAAPEQPHSDNGSRQGWKIA